MPINIQAWRSGHNTLPLDLDHPLSVKITFPVMYFL